MDRIGYTDAEKYTSDLVKTIVNKVLEENGTDYISSILVTGSFGRGEPTFEVTTEGTLMLRSDIEIALVYDRMVDKRKILEIKERVESQFSEALELMPFQKRRLVKAQNHNYAFIEPKYKTLFTYDIFNGSYTAWGEDYISQKKLLIKDVDVFEAKRIVANRIGESVCFFPQGQNISRENYNRQWKGKILLAIVSAWLLCEGEYESSYRIQYEKACGQIEKVTSVFGQHFIKDYTHTFEYLRNNGKPYCVADDRLREYVSAINEIFKDRNIHKSRVNCLSKKIRSYIKYIKIHSNYGLNFENQILQELIDGYVNDDELLSKKAQDWFKVLYY